ncbi:hypothetical protein KSP40_PGU016047 [Platanthera guangdongensis]|uniref:Uncharacterized protein n=1 Tax=Platanthera guangdongensis TaxID=2320717 RepID=A0ABR2LTW1_9ASPA
MLFSRFYPGCRQDPSEGSDASPNHGSPSPPTRPSFEPTPNTAAPPVNHSSLDIKNSENDYIWLPPLLRQVSLSVICACPLEVPSEPPATDYYAFGGTKPDNITFSIP